MISHIFTHKSSAIFEIHSQIKRDNKRYDYYRLKDYNKADIIILHIHICHRERNW